jgi:hypothetical protein
MKHTKKYHFTPGRIPLLIFKIGLPAVILLLIYIIYFRMSAKPDDLLYITRELHSMLEYVLMSLVILCGGAAAFESVTRKS